MVLVPWSFVNIHARGFAGEMGSVDAWMSPPPLLMGWLWLCAWPASCNRVSSCQISPPEQLPDRPPVHAVLTAALAVRAGWLALALASVVPLLPSPSPSPTTHVRAAAPPSVPRRPCLSRRRSLLCTSACPAVCLLSVPGLTCAAFICPQSHCCCFFPRCSPSFVLPTVLPPARCSCNSTCLFP